MRDFVLYLQGRVTLGLLLLAALKLLAMHGLPLPYNENHKDFATNSPRRGNVGELDDEVSEIEPLKVGELIEPIVFEPKEGIGLSRSTYRVNSCIDLDHVKIPLGSLGRTYIDFPETCGIQIVLEH